MSAGLIVWEDEDGSCMYCDGETQVAVDAEACLAERCPSCKWQINFEPLPHRVEFGTEVQR